MDINELATQVKNLNNLVNALSKKIDNVKFYQDADNQGMRNTESGLSEKNIEQDGGINENSVCVLDVADLANENSICIEDLAEMVEDLEERVSALEGKEVE